MKKFCLSAILAVSLVLIVSACGADKTAVTGEIIKSEAQGSTETPAKIESPSSEIKINSSDFTKYKLYKDVQELEQSSDLIVHANFSGKRQVNVYRGAQGEPTYTNSISTIQIQKVFKGDIAEKTEIQTYEPGFYEGNVYNNVEGYNLVNEKGKYVLFLRSNDNGIYTVVGMYQGKFDLNAPKQLQSVENKTMENSEYLGEDVKHFNELKQEVLDKYGT